MIYPVIIKNEKGEIKKTISSKKLQNLHWQKFNKKDKFFGGKQRKPSKENSKNRKKHEKEFSKFKNVGEI